ncbi:DUF3309 family protein [Arenibaculum sp.]|jgi:hypothetical protein|uniref:DUF3309 family protein n=1 Tax=Arenibaculum sp. TaxID=2865862 RepID=UPI002E11F92F|nr:DUF3309 family protein [Arenibaculum sp.]
MGFWFFLLLVLVVVAALPWWRHSREWGYVPGSLLFTLLLVWLVMIWMGWIAFALPWTARI